MTERCTAFTFSRSVTHGILRAFTTEVCRPKTTIYLPMPLCMRCHVPMRRTKRTLIEKVNYWAAYECSKCGERETRSKHSLVSMHARCPRCYSHVLRVRKKRDWVDTMNRNPF